jgi:hypothetical protein
LHLNCRGTVGNFDTFLLCGASVFPIPHGKRLGANLQTLEAQIVDTAWRTARPRAGAAAGSEIHELLELFSCFVRNRF